MLHVNDGKVPMSDVPVANSCLMNGRQVSGFAEVSLNV